MQFDYTVGAELEFYICSPDGFCIADLSSGKFPQKRYELLDKYKIPVQNFLEELKKQDYDWSAESGPGQFEVQFTAVNDKRELVEDINKFKELSQTLAAKYDLLVTFAAKPYDGHPGSGLHIHLCSNLFDPYGLEANNGVVTAKRHAENKYILWAIGGMLKNMKQHKDIFFPTEHSLKRVVPYLNAPTKICWGRNNRSCAIRIPDSKPMRIEHRVAGSDADAKAVINAVIADAEYGINSQTDAGEQVFGNAWDAQYKREPIL